MSRSASKDDILFSTLYFIYIYIHLNIEMKLCFSFFTNHLTLKFVENRYVGWRNLTKVSYSTKEPKRKKSFLICKQCYYYTLNSSFFILGVIDIILCSSFLYFPSLSSCIHTNLVHIMRCYYVHKYCIINKAS